MWLEKLEILNSVYHKRLHNHRLLSLTILIFKFSDFQKCLASKIQIIQRKLICFKISKFNNKTLLCVKFLQGARFLRHLKRLKNDQSLQSLFLYRALKQFKNSRIYRVAKYLKMKKKDI